MHSAVMQNKKYIKFSDKNTVEVLALGRLDEGIAKKDRKAATYEAKGSDGKTAEYMVQWPSLTHEQITSLSRSKAATYNKTGRIPYTAIVDPHTLAELGHGYSSASSISKAVQGFRKSLTKQYGKGITRKHLRKIDKGVKLAGKLQSQGEFSKALAALDKVDPGQGAPEALASTLSHARKDVTTAAKDALQQAENLLAENPREGKRALNRLMSRLRGTGLEQQARGLLKSASSSN